MSPRRKTERDVSERDGTDGRHRRMSLRRKAQTGWALRLKVFPSEGYPFVSFVGAVTVSETDAPWTDGTERDTPKTDTPETDGAETEAPETDVPEMEYVRSLRY